MTRVADIMTRGVRAMQANDSVVQAAQAMQQLNIGAVPVCDGQRLVGMVTDRDITIRAVAHGRADPGVTLSSVMSADVDWCREDQNVQEVMRDMSKRQIRRLPVLDRDQHLVGMLSLGDIAAKADGAQVSQLLADISRPARADRQAAALAGAGDAARRSPAQSRAHATQPRGDAAWGMQSGASPRGTASPADEDPRSAGA